MSNDSIGRYDGYSDRFNIQSSLKLKDPNEVLRSLTVHSKDTISTSQDKIDTEIINRLQIRSGGLDHDKLPVVARAGKFVFMAVAVPTYLVAYSIPKWIATHLIPHSCQMIGKGIKQCFKPMQELVMLFMRQFQRILKLFQKERFQISKALAHFKGWMAALKQPFNKLKNLWQMMRQKISERKSALEEILSGLKNKSKKSLQAAGESLRKRAKKMVFGRLSKEEPLPYWRQQLIALAKTIQRGYRYAAALPKKAAEAVKKAVIETYTAYVLPPVMAVLQPIQRAVQKTTKFVRTKTEAFTGFCRKIAARQIERFKKALDGVKKAVSERAAALYHFLGIPKLTQKAVDVWNSAVSVWSSALNRVSRPFKAIAHRGRSLADRAKQTGTKISASLSSAGQKAKAFLQANIILPFTGLLHRFASKPMKMAANGRKNVQKMMKALLNRVSGIQKTKDALKKPALSFRRWKSKAGRKARRAVYYSRLTVSWSKILTGFWMASVRNTCQTCVDHFTWRDIVYFLRNMGEILGSALRNLAERTKRRRLKTSNNQ